MAAVTSNDLTSLKDSVLNRIADSANIAQFVSFDPKRQQRHSRIRGCKIDHTFGSITEAAAALLNVSGSVNVRSFEPNSAKSRDFIYGLKTSDDVSSVVSTLSATGLYTIINETIDVQDGG